MRKFIAMPPYLNQGSTGAAIQSLIAWAEDHDHILGELDPQLAIEQIGYFEINGPLADYVKAYQRLVGLTGDDVDGHFGPATRMAIKNWRDDNGAPFDWFADDELLEERAITHYYRPDMEGPQVWDIKAAEEAGAQIITE